MVSFFEEIFKGVVQFLQHIYQHIRCHSKCCKESECDCDCANGGNSVKSD